MRFRTEITVKRSPHPIVPTDGIVMLGSCFTDNIGEQMAMDGLDVLANPAGPLFNPLSVARFISRALDGENYTTADLVQDSRDGSWHLLDLASRYSGNDPEAVVAAANTALGQLSNRLAEARHVIITFGTTRTFFLANDNTPVGNCHKMPTDIFVERHLSIDEIVSVWTPILVRLADKHIVFTVSPVRHTGEDMHQNTLSKARLHLAVEQMLGCGANIEYFPAYEIVNDDLRDYRFYADDLKHPSAMAVTYIHEHFKTTYYPAATEAHASEARRVRARNAHRPILTQ